MLGFTFSKCDRQYRVLTHMLKWWFALYVDQWVDVNLSASLLRIGLDGSAVDLLLRVVYCYSCLAS